MGVTLLELLVLLIILALASVLILSLFSVSLPGIYGDVIAWYQAVAHPYVLDAFELAPDSSAGRIVVKLIDVFGLGAILGIIHRLTIRKAA